MIEIEIDGQKIEAEPGSMIIEAADKVGIKIPRFCYHKFIITSAVNTGADEPPGITAFKR